MFITLGPRIFFVKYFFFKNSEKMDDIFWPILIPGRFTSHVHFDATTVSIMTLNMTTLNKMAFQHNDTQHNDTQDNNN